MTQKIRIGRIYNGSAGDVILQSKTVEPSTVSQTITPDRDFQGLSSVTVNAIPVVELATPALAIDNNGLISSTVIQSGGYIVESMKSNTLQLLTREGSEIIPSTYDTVIPAHVYTTGNITIKGDTNLIPENIKEGVELFGVTGTHIGEQPEEGEEEVNLFHGVVTRNFNPPIDLKPSDFAGLTSLGYGAFAHQNGINSIELPETITTLGLETFYSTNIKKIILPSSIIQYESNTFGGSGTTEEIVFKTSFEIPRDCFTNWSQLNKIDLTYLDAGLKTNSYFQSTNSNCKIYFKAHLYDYYLSSSIWSKFTLCPQGRYFPEIKPKVIVLSNEPSLTITEKVIGDFIDPIISFTGFDSSNLTVTDYTYTPPADEQNIGSLTATITGKAESMNTIKIIISDGESNIEREFSLNIKAELAPSTWSVSDVENAAYNFTLNTDGYYQNTNQMVQNSYSICQVNINSNGVSRMYIEYLMNSEQGYDYGMVSQLDTALTLSTKDDASLVSTSFRNGNTTTPKSVEIGVIPDGNHFVEIKYRKDGSGDNGTDTFQFTIRFE